MLNLDMVGRARGEVDVSGLEASPSMEADLKAAASAAGGGLKIRRQGPGAGRSDDANFIDRRIPAINFFTGFHPDYHRPTDDWEKIDARGNQAGRDARAGARGPPGRTRPTRPNSCAARRLTIRLALRIRRRRADAAEKPARRADSLLNAAALAQHQPPAMQTRLQRLILHLQPAARLFGRQPSMSRSTTGAR